MAQNNETQVVNGVVQPRLYQVYGDLIESKEVMEPIAIANGTGPVCGFDWVDTTKNTLTIGSIFSSDREDMKRGARRVFLSNKDNTAGQVFNAFITPDGLLSIAPDILTLTGQNPPGGWPDMSNPSKMVTFALIATHRYSANKDEPVPSLSNFKVAWLTNAHVEPEYYIDKIVDMNYPQILDWVTKKSSVSINSNTDTLLGVYMIGWIPSWNTLLPGWKELMQSIGYQLCINPYQGILPAKPLGMNPFSLMRLDNRVRVLEQSTVPIEVGDLARRVSNQMRSWGFGVEAEYTINSVSEEDEFVFTKLIISGCVLATSSSPVTKRINYQWYEAGGGLVIYSTKPYINQSTLNPEDWGLANAALNIPLSKDQVWDGTLNLSSLPSQAYPMAFFEIVSVQGNGEKILPGHAISLVNTTKVDGLTRFGTAVCSVFDNFGRVYSRSLLEKYLGSGSQLHSISGKIIVSSFSITLVTSLNLKNLAGNSEDIDIDLETWLVDSGVEAELASNIVKRIANNLGIMSNLLLVRGETWPSSVDGNTFKYQIFAQTTGTSGVYPKLKLSTYIQHNASSGTSITTSIRTVTTFTAPEDMLELFTNCINRPLYPF